MKTTIGKVSRRPAREFARENGRAARSADRSRDRSVIRGMWAARRIMTHRSVPGTSLRRVVTHQRVPSGRASAVPARVPTARARRRGARAARRSRANRDDASDGRRPSRSELGARGRVDAVRWMVPRSETLATTHARWVRRPRRALVRDVELFSRARTASDLSRASDSVAEVVERVRRERAEGDVNARGRTRTRTRTRRRRV